MKHLTGSLPWTKSCYVCGEQNRDGFQLRSRVENGVVLLEYTTQPNDVGYRHIVHGGILMTLLDEVMTWAAILETGKVCVAAEITTRLKQPIGVGEALRVEGRVEKNAKRLILTSGRIINVSGDVVIEASGKYVPSLDSQTAFQHADFVLSPHVLSLENILSR